MNKLILLDQEFSLYLPADKIQAGVQDLADRMNHELKNEDVIFMGILNGAFMFASDLLRRIKLNAQITFVKLSSYQGRLKSGPVRRLIGINESLSNKTVVVIEDIVDTGTTIENIIAEITKMHPAIILIATLLLKPEQYTKDIEIHYVGFRIPKNFIVGYGLDYKGLGRNLNDLYMLEE